jgi:hypothetical protein
MLATTITHLNAHLPSILAVGEPQADVSFWVDIIKSVAVVMTGIGLAMGAYILMFFGKFAAAYHKGGGLASAFKQTKTDLIFAGLIGLGFTIVILLSGVFNSLLGIGNAEITKQQGVTITVPAKK